MDVIQTPLTIFQPPPIDKTIQKEYWVEFNPIAAITDSSVIEFNIPGTSVDYINLAKTRLHVKYIITDEKGFLFIISHHQLVNLQPLLTRWRL